jgi:hypothetical protein
MRDRVKGLGVSEEVRGGLRVVDCGCGLGQA